MPPPSKGIFSQAEIAFGSGGAQLLQSRVGIGDCGQARRTQLYLVNEFLGKS